MELVYCPICGTESTTYVMLEYIGMGFVGKVNDVLNDCIIREDALDVLFRFYSVINEEIHIYRSNVRILSKF